MELSIRLFDLAAGNLWAALDAVSERWLRRQRDDTSGARLRLGSFGERLAARHLRRRGYRIVARNFRAPGGEIDLVALDGGTLVFIEVKTRTDERFGTPAEAVDEDKQNHIRVAAAGFPRRRGVPTRFDIVAILGRPGAYRVEHLKNAFAPRQRELGIAG
ncbi:MAG TPA: YraN family protein [Candidatus Binataceae bacterium]|nr:YraN family protein [Candidatus Binataceae bacterium]